MTTESPTPSANAAEQATAPARTNGNGTHRRLLTAGEVADLLGVPRSWVYEQSRNGRIPTVTLGRYRRYRADAIEAWIEQIEAPAGRTLRPGIRNG